MIFTQYFESYTCMYCQIIKTVVITRVILSLKYFLDHSYTVCFFIRHRHQTQTSFIVWRFIWRIKNAPKFSSLYTSVCLEMEMLTRTLWQILCFNVKPLANLTIQWTTSLSPSELILYSVAETVIAWLVIVVLSGFILIWVEVWAEVYNTVVYLWFSRWNCWSVAFHDSLIVVWDILVTVLKQM